MFKWNIIFTWPVIILWGLQSLGSCRSGVIKWSYEFCIPTNAGNGQVTSYTTETHSGLWGPMGSTQRYWATFHHLLSVLANWGGPSWLLVSRCDTQPHCLPPRVLGTVTAGCGEDGDGDVDGSISFPALLPPYSWPPHLVLNISASLSGLLLFSFCL